MTSVHPANSGSSPVDRHVEWERESEETQGTAVNFPMSGDPDRHVADLYDMIHPNADDTFTVRSVFVIGPDTAATVVGVEVGGRTAPRPGRS